MVLASTGRRPRAHSASSLKAHQVLQPLPSGLAYPGHGFFGPLAGAAGAGGVSGGPGGGISGKTLSYSSPELRSMLVGLETTVPQNLNPPSHLGSRHKPCKKRRKIGGSRSSLYQLSIRQDSEAMMGSRQSDPDPGASCRCSPCCAPGARGCGCCTCCGAAEEERVGEGGRGCCRVQILLVLLQLLLGAGVTSVAVYMHLFHRAAFVLRDTPMWAGAPLCCSGIAGIYFCASNFKEYSQTARAFVLKVLCSILSAGSVFLCVVAAIFAAIHLGRALTYTTCVPTESDCLCRLPQDMGDDEDEVFPRVFLYPAAAPARGQGQGPGPGAGAGDCQEVLWQVKTYLATSGSLCLAGSLVSLWFVALLWKARYGRFHSGVRLPSIRRKYYSAPLF